MRLNNVIILNRRHLKEFFSFTEFWAKRKEFLDVANSDIFFRPKDKDCQKNQLKAQVINWIKGRSLTKDKKLGQTYITLPSGNLSRYYTTQCENELKQLTSEEAFGIVCLYEMIERTLKQDIYEILTCLGYEIFNPLSGVIVVQNNADKELEPYEKDGDQDTGAKLCNVLIANLSKEKSGVSTIKLGDEQVDIQPNECIRAVFYGTKCLKILPTAQHVMRFVLNLENYTTGLSVDEAVVKTTGNVVAFAYGRNGGYVYATDSQEKKFVASHRNIGDEYFYNPIHKDENIIYIELNRSETECLLLTDQKKLYLCKAHNEDEILFVDDNVIMASFEKDELQILKS